MKELGFDSTINYKASKNIYADIKYAFQNCCYDLFRKACPKGVDVFFDNVGGDILDGALRNLNRGTILSCLLESCEVQEL